MTTIVPTNLDNPYSTVITDLFTHQFPGSNPCNNASVLEALTTEIIGTKQHRNGPTPNPESLVSIREVIRESIDNKKPIPTLIPWGGYKPIGTGADVADLMGLKQISSLANRVKMHYPIGLDLRMRLEGYTDQTLYDPTAPAVEKSLKYMQQIMDLRTILGINMQIHRESDVVDKVTFRSQAYRNSDALIQVLGELEHYRKPLIRKLVPYWRGDITDEMRDHYLRGYKRFYPTESPDQHFDRLARYFSRSLTRYQLGATGTTGWDKFITLAFVSTPFGRTGRRVHYRTIPERYTHLHFPPWIGKGYLRIDGNKATPAIAGSSGDGLTYQQSTIKVTGQDRETVIQCDYVVEV